MLNELRNLKSEGFCVIKNFFDLDLIQTILNYLSSLHTVKNEDIYTENGIISGLKYVFDKNDIFLQTLSHPKLLKLLNQIYGKDELILPTWEDIILKQPLSGEISVHQDLPPEIKNHSGNVYAFGICLSDTFCNPVHMLPKSHLLGALTKEKVVEIASTNKNLFVPVIANAGDLVIHNNLTIHFSNKNNSNFSRYTWYLEFRSVSDIISNSTWDINWAYSRRYLLYHSLKLRKEKKLETHNLKFPDLNILLKYAEPLKLRIPH